jgi:hypothetical protein
MPIQFSVPRLVLVAVVFAGAFWFTMPFGAWGVPFALLVAIPFSGIVLVAKTHDVIPMVRSLVFCGLGALIAVSLSPAIRPPYQLGDEFGYMIVGAFVGWLIGLGIAPRRPSDDTSDTEQPGILGTDGWARKRRWIWNVAAPLVAFLSGPVVAFLFWTLEVYVFNRAAGYMGYYEGLVGAIPIGVLLGLLAGIVVAMQVLSSFAKDREMASRKNVGPKGRSPDEPGIGENIDKNR